MVPVYRRGEVMDEKIVAILPLDKEQQREYIGCEIDVDDAWKNYTGSCRKQRELDKKLCTVLGVKGWSFTKRFGSRLVVFGENRIGVEPDDGSSAGYAGIAKAVVR